MAQKNQCNNQNTTTTRERNRLHLYTLNMKNRVDRHFHDTEQIFSYLSFILRSIKETIKEANKRTESMEGEETEQRQRVE